LISFLILFAWIHSQAVSSLENYQLIIKNIYSILKNQFHHFLYQYSTESIKYKSK